MTAVTREASAPAVVSSVRGRRHLDQREQEKRVALGLGGFAALVVLGVALWPTVVPTTLLLVPLVIGTIVLGPRSLPWLAGFLIATVALTQVILALHGLLLGRGVAAALVQVGIIAIALVANHRRIRLGVAGARGESMFVELRDRILSQCGIPDDLPPDWLVESSLVSAGGTPFAGDFVVAARPEPGHRLAVVLVDVSGKGEEAGTRALLLSGAMAGLLGTMPAGEFLRAANDYLIQHGWEEGFATAVHLSVDLRTGDYELRTAGHPPAVRRDASSGRWQILTTEGPVLGVVERPLFRAVRGHLDRGDALMLYTDGMVEDSSRDIDLGIDRMLGQAESTLRGVYEGGAERLVEALGSPQDDRALVVVHRR